MSKHSKLIQTSQNMVAPEGKRISGPGTRSKNPARYDANKPATK